MHILIGDQGNRTFWREAIASGRLPRPGAVIDDGGHQFSQQVVTFEELFPHLNDGGVFLTEDTHTSYFPHAYGGGLRKQGTFIEYAKHFVDYLNAHHWTDPVLDKDERSSALTFRREASAVHFYDSTMVVEKTIDDEVPRPLERGGPKGDAKTSID